MYMYVAVSSVNNYLLLNRTPREAKAVYPRDWMRKSNFKSYGKVSVVLSE